MDLRAEVQDVELVSGVVRDWRQAPLERVSERARALCAHAEKLTRAPHAIDEQDMATLRAAGLDDEGIHDLTQVVALFNYYNIANKNVAELCNHQRATPPSHKACRTE